MFRRLEVINAFVVLNAELKHVKYVTVENTP